MLAWDAEVYRTPLPQDPLPSQPPDEPPEPPPPPPPKLPKSTKVIIGGISGVMVTCLVHPLDLVKSRMQMYPRRVRMSDMASRVIRCEGMRALYLGLTAAFLRQCTYTTTMIGVYHYLYEKRKVQHGILGLSDKMSIGVYASMAGVVTGAPADIAQVRMMTDCPKEPCQMTKAPYRRRYKGCFHAIYKIARTEGVRGLWRGGSLSLTRATLVVLVQIGTYIKTRDYLYKHKLADGLPLHICTSVISSLVAAFISLPVDRVKVRYQARRDRVPLKKILNNIYKCGYIRLWNGFLPYYFRITLHTSLTYVFIQEITKIYSKWHFEPLKGPDPEIREAEMEAKSLLKEEIDEDHKSTETYKINKNDVR